MGAVGYWPWCQHPASRGYAHSLGCGERCSAGRGPGRVPLVETSPSILCVACRVGRDDVAVPRRSLRLGEAKTPDSEAHPRRPPIPQGPDPLQRGRDHDFSMGWQRTALRRVGFAVAFAEPAFKHQNHGRASAACHRLSASKCVFRPGDARLGIDRPEIDRSGIAVGMNSAATGNGVGRRRRPAGFCHAGQSRLWVRAPSLKRLGSGPVGHTSGSGLANQPAHHGCDGVDVDLEATGMDYGNAA